MDVIASTSFGLQTDSQTNKDDPFTKYAQKITDAGAGNPMLFMLSKSYILKPLHFYSILSQYP